MLKTLPIFPCAANKKPLTSKGFHDAAIGLDPSGWPLVGVRTGAASAIDVLDVDPEGIPWLAQNEHRLPVTRRHRTQRGVHLLFRHAEGLKKSEDRVAKGVDVRADGSYAIWWPRQGYSVANEDTVAEWPEWLLVLARKASRVRLPSWFVQPKSADVLELQVLATSDPFTAMALECFEPDAEGSVRKP